MAGDLEHRITELIEQVARASGDARNPVLEQLGDAYKEAGKPVKAVACYSQAWDSGARTVAIRRKYALELAASGREQEALVIVSEEPDPRGDPVEYGRLLLARGRVLWRMGRHDEADTLANRAKEWLAQHHAPARDISSCLNLSAIVRMSLGRFAEAISPLERARELAVDDKDVGAQLRAESNLGDVQRCLGDYDTALRWIDGVISKATAAGFPLYAGSALANRATIEQHRGDLESARLSLRSAQRSIAAAGDSLLQSQVSVLQADLLADAGDWNGARSQATKCLERFRELGDRRNEALSLLVLARADRAGRQLKAAMEKAVLALDQAMAHDLREPRCLALRLLGVIEADSGDVASGIRRLEDSVNRFRVAGMVVEEAISRVELARILLAAGKAGEARRQADQARPPLQRAGAAGWLRVLDGMSAIPR